MPDNEADIGSKFDDAFMASEEMASLRLLQERMGAREYNRLRSQPSEITGGFCRAMGHVYGVHREAEHA